MSHTPGPWDADDFKEANARLIAAAPDLLEALVKLHKKFLDLYGCFPPNHGTGEKYYGAMVEAESAIKKARGE